MNIHNKEKNLQWQWRSSSKYFFWQPSFVTTTEESSQLASLGPSLGWKNIWLFGRINQLVRKQLHISTHCHWSTKLDSIVYLYLVQKGTGRGPQVVPCCLQAVLCLWKLEIFDHQPNKASTRKTGAGNEGFYCTSHKIFLKMGTYCSESLDITINCQFTLTFH